MLLIQPNPTSASHHQETNVHVPLKSVRVDAKIRSFATDVQITQVFRNGWIHGDPTTFWKKFSCAVPLCGNDRTPLKNIFGNKIG